MPSSDACLAVLLLGYYLCFTAWLSETKGIPIKLVIQLCLGALALATMSGVGLYYTLT